MGTVHDASTNGKPYEWSLKQHQDDPTIPLDRPEICLLASYLCEEDYTPESRGATLRQAARDGHLEGLEAAGHLNHPDREMADYCLEVGGDRVPEDDPSWSDPARYVPTAADWADYREWCDEVDRRDGDNRLNPNAPYGYE